MVRAEEHRPKDTCELYTLEADDPTKHPTRQVNVKEDLLSAPRPAPFISTLRFAGATLRQLSLHLAKQRFETIDTVTHMLCRRTVFARDVLGGGDRTDLVVVWSTITQGKEPPRSIWQSNHLHNSRPTKLKAQQVVNLPTVSEIRQDPLMQALELHADTNPDATTAGRLEAAETVADEAVWTEAGILYDTVEDVPVPSGQRRWLTHSRSTTIGRFRPIRTRFS